MSVEPDLLASSLVLERVPYLFANNWPAFRNWRRQFASRIGADPCDIFITGSAAVGLSLSPTKGLSSFSPFSDIDVSVVSPAHFDLAWQHIRSLKRSRVSGQEWDSVKAHMTNYIYWGCIATDRILHLLPFAKPWADALTYMEGLEESGGRETKVRIYRDTASLRGYIQNSIKSLRAELAMAA